MMTLNNFSSRQLASTEGFKRKIQKVAKQLDIEKVLYFEIVNIDVNSVEVLIIDESMYFSKVLLYSKEVINILNTKYEALILDLNLSTTDNIINRILESDEKDLIDEFKESLSKSLEYLNIENSSELNKLDKVTSADFSINLEKFTYDELEKIVLPIVKQKIKNLFKFKIINLAVSSLELLIITNDCKLFQYKISLKSDFSKFINRYISSILGNNNCIDFRRNMLTMSFIEALNSTVYNATSKCDVFDAISFITFLMEKFELNTTSIGCGSEGLKNVYKFFLDTSSNEEEAKKKIIQHFMTSKTFVDKKS